MKFSLISHNEKETIKIAKNLATFLSKGDIVTLNGDLGAGKTTFVKGIAKGLKIKEAIISPTFNILKIYQSNTIHLYHIDAYRLNESNKDIGLEEYIEGDGIALIEWPIYIKELLNKKHLDILLEIKGDKQRKIIFNAPNKYFANIVKEVIK